MRNLALFVFVALIAFLLVAATPSVSSAAGPAYHVVQPGQNLSSIASWYGMSTWSLARANGIWNPDYIYVGQVLVIPGYAPVPCPGCGYPPPPPPNPWPQPVYRCTYWVQYGDSLSAIAWRYRVDAWTLARANGIYNLNWIYVGQRLQIPGCY